MAKRQVTAIVRIQLPAGKATPAPPVGTALGPHGIQTMEFVKQYNAATEDKVGQVIPVEVTIFSDRSFSFVLKTSPTGRAHPPGTRSRQGGAKHRQRSRGHAERRPGDQDRPYQDAGPQCQRPRGGQGANCRDGAVHGRKSRLGPGGTP